METWEEIYEQYHMDEYPVFGGPFTSALTFKEWLEVWYHPPVRKEMDLSYKTNELDENIS
jgi:hypothetical protein